MGAAARARAIEHFTLDRAISAFDEMYTLLGRAAVEPADADVTPDSAAVAAPLAEAGHQEQETTTRPSHWIELPPEDASTVVALVPDLRRETLKALAEMGYSAALEAIAEESPEPSGQRRRP